MKEKKEKLANSLIFMSPRRLIRSDHFTKKDVRNIKYNLTWSFSLVYMIIAAILAVLMSALYVFMSINSNNQFIEVYGLPAFFGLITVIACSGLSVILTVLSRILKDKKKALILCRIAGDILYIGAATYMLSCIFSDAQMGFTANQEALSASIIFIAILALIQPMNWIDAAILDTLVSIGIIVDTFVCLNLFQMGAVQYYILIAIFFLFACYMVVSLLFYAESQRYKQVLENERLHNRAYYDNLTRCKNRHALSEFLNENKYRWENKENINLLIVLFDIDDFKKYNDQFSHLGGDYCLKSICDAIRHEFPSPSLDFFRYGGEEFLLFFELRNIEDAPIMLNKIKESVSTLDITAPKGAPKQMVTISVGGLLIRNIQEFEFENEMKIVDAYLYKAKNAGKDVVCYNGDLIN